MLISEDNFFAENFQTLLQTNLNEIGVFIHVSSTALSLQTQNANKSSWQDLQQRFGVHSEVQPAWEISHTAHGAPFIKHHPQIFISKARSALNDNTMLYALGAAKRPIGLDLEIMRDARHSQNLTHSIIQSAFVFLHAQERASLVQTAQIENEAALLKLWCAKEAYVKAIQLGSARDFTRVLINFDAAHATSQHSAATVTASSFTITDDGMCVSTQHARVWQIETSMFQKHNRHFFFALVML